MFARGNNGVHNTHIRTLTNRISELVKENLELRQQQFPWQLETLQTWAIVGMNHYCVEGVRHLFVAMTKDGHCIIAEGADEASVFTDLTMKAEKFEELQEAQGWTGKKCPDCKGTGEEDEDRRSCVSCAGTGDEYISELMKITLNGKEHKVHRGYLLYREICELSGYNVRQRPTITYRGAATNGNGQGILIHGQILCIDNNTTEIDCIETGSA